MVESFSLSQNQAEKMVYVEAKSDQYERSYVCLKFKSILSRATLARFVRTLPARSSAPSDPILFPHILFFSWGSDLKKSFQPFFTQKFFWEFPPSFSKNGKKLHRFPAIFRWKYTFFNINFLFILFGNDINIFTYSNSSWSCPSYESLTMQIRPV